MDKLCKTYFKCISYDWIFSFLYKYVIYSNACNTLEGKATRTRDFGYKLYS